MLLTRVEALALSDMIGVMNKGKIVELGTPRKIYFDADHRFVADFIGRSNLIPAKLLRQEKLHTIVRLRSVKSHATSGPLNRMPSWFFV